MRLPTIIKKYSEFLILSSLVVFFCASKLNVIYSLAANSSEAAFIILGRMRIFYNDWFTYDPKNWIGAESFLYPPLAGIFSSIGGVFTVRIVSMLFGIGLMEIVYLTVKQVYNPKKKILQSIAAISSLILLTPLPFFYFFSRIASYDLPSFFFVFLAIYLLAKARRQNSNPGKLYFFAGISLILSVLIRTNTVVFVLPITALALVTINTSTPKNRLFFIRYFIFPLGVCLAFLALTHKTLLTPHLITFDNVDYSAEVFALSIVVCMLIGVFIAQFFSRMNNTKIKTLFAAIFSGLILIYFFDAYHYSQRYDVQEHDLSEMLQVIVPKLSPGDRVLSSDASQIMLAAYQAIRPTQIDTTNWFMYKDKTGPEAIGTAIADGYFSIIQINSSSKNSWISTAVATNYEQVFNNKSYIVYKRSF